MYTVQLEQWLHLEDVGMIDNDDQKKRDTCNQQNQLHFINQLISLLKDVYDTKSNDDHTMYAAAHMLSQYPLRLEIVFHLPH